MYKKMIITHSYNFKNPLVFSFLLVLYIHYSYTSTSRTIYLCPKDFIPIRKKCYFFSNDSVTWNEAHFNCIYRNSSLAVINRFNQDTFLRNYLEKKSEVLGEHERWIGGKYNWKKSEWVWGASGKTIDYLGFSRRDLIMEKEWQCITLNPDRRYKWSSKNCFHKQRYVCQTETNPSIELRLASRRSFNINKCNDPLVLNTFERQMCIRRANENTKLSNGPAQLSKVHSSKPVTSTNPLKAHVCPKNMFHIGRNCYTFSKDKTNFHDAYHNCSSKKLKLAIIKNKKENDALRDFLEDNFVEKHERWIGGVFDWKANNWIWAISGKVLKFKGFGKYVLKNRNLSWAGIIMDPELQYRWNIRLLSDEKHYICQVKRKTIVQFPNPQVVQATIIIKNNSATTIN